MTFRPRLFSIAIAILPIAIFSCHSPTKPKSPEQQKIDFLTQKTDFYYSANFHGLYIRRCDLDALPDSIKSKDLKHLVIVGATAIDLDVLSRHLDLTKIWSVRIDDLNKPTATFDLKEFNQLNSLAIYGTENVTKINVTNGRDSLRMLSLSAPQLTFPDFDSTFLKLTSFRYSGTSEVIPQWVESLNNLTTFAFISKHLSEIQCDACKMNALDAFAIVDLDVADKESHLKKMSVYSSVQKFRTCKPELQFWTVLPPE